MAVNPDRTSFFPAIERKHGKPITEWIALVQTLDDSSYKARMAVLQENHGFSRTHANALVLYCRGSQSAHRFGSVDDYLADHDAVKQQTVRRILAVVKTHFPAAETVIAWNQPMIRLDGRYVFGLGVFKNHILIAPYDTDVLEEMRDRLSAFKVNKETIQVPVDWEVDDELIRDLIQGVIDRS